MHLNLINILQTYIKCYDIILNDPTLYAKWFLFIGPLGPLSTYGPVDPYDPLSVAN